MEAVMCGLPVRSFGHAKSRLRQAVPTGLRRQIAQEMATRTALAAATAGMAVIVITEDGEVKAWAESNGWPAQSRGADSLDGGARALVEDARMAGRAWTVLHADLPLIQAHELIPAVAALDAGRAVIAPSADGGTTLIGTPGTEVEFAYGPGSFRTHLQRIADLDPVVLTSSGLGCDLDVPDDLSAAAARAEGAWLRTLVGTLAGS
jgi:2-phospho-L-lactate guanylyltransferase